MFKLIFYTIIVFFILKKLNEWGIFNAKKAIQMLGKLFE